MPVQPDSPAPEATPSGTAPPRAIPLRASHPLVVLVIVLAGTVVAVDQLTKIWAVSALSGGDSVVVLGDLLSIHLTYNSGAAFSIGSGYTWIFTVTTTVAIVAVAFAARRVRSRAWAVTLGLVLGGAVTHLLDRLFREPGIGRGHVVDFIDYADLFVGNVADIALVGGALLWVLLTLRGVRLDGRRATNRPSS